MPRFATGVAVLVVAGFLTSGSAAPPRPSTVAAIAPAPSAGSGPVPRPIAEVVPPAAPAPPGLTVIGYQTPPPPGLPADPTPLSTAPLTEGLRPIRAVAIYDAPGGQPRAYLPPTMSGVPVTVPIVEHRVGWVAVLLPSVNRTIGWAPPAGWVPVRLPGQLVLRRQARELSWYHEGALTQAWTVTIGAPATPTPLGRTFVLGRSRLPGAVYAGVDVLALGSVPDNPGAVATGLRGAHTGIHGWYRNEFGRNISNGCVRVPKAVQQYLLTVAVPGTAVIVVD